MTDFSEQTRGKAGTDEWFTPTSAITPLLPYLEGFRTVWCPFDRYDDEIKSNYVEVLKDAGHIVAYSHIDYGQDFLDYRPDVDVDAVVSNPPYSLRNAVLNRLYELDVPFAMLMNYAGLFDNRIGYGLFKNKGVELFVLDGRTNFIKKGATTHADSPLFQAIYICRGILPEQIVFQRGKDMTFLMYIPKKSDRIRFDKNMKKMESELDKVKDYVESIPCPYCNTDVRLAIRCNYEDKPISWVGCGFFCGCYSSPNFDDTASLVVAFDKFRESPPGDMEIEDTEELCTECGTTFNMRLISCRSGRFIVQRAFPPRRENIVGRKKTGGKGTFTCPACWERIKREDRVLTPYDVDAWYPEYYVFKDLDTFYRDTVYYAGRGPDGKEIWKPRKFVRERGISKRLNKYRIFEVYDDGYGPYLRYTFTSPAVFEEIRDMPTWDGEIP